MEPTLMTTDKTAIRSWFGLVLLTAGLLAGCGGMTKSECEKADWRMLGQRDAEDGRASSARFTQRAESCIKAGVVNANQTEYLAGHALGQISYCTADRGRDEALAGQPPSDVCQVPSAATVYRAGYDAGLLRFCTVKSGLEFGRHGFTHRNTCPAESATAFEVGYRLGSEQYELNRRLKQISLQQADERKVLADAKTTPTGRESANRRLGQLDGDEAAVRKLIRQAEANALSITQPANTPAAPAGAPLTRALAAELLIGQWQLAAMRLNTPVDLNRDGVKSADALSEYTACERDARLEIGGDQKSTLRIGGNTPGCKPIVKTYAWRLSDGKVRNARQENGRRVVDERAVVMLQLRAAKSTDSLGMVVESLGADTLTVRTDLPDGTDTSSEAALTYKRVKP
jgi:hypothetical protein